MKRLRYLFLPLLLAIALVPGGAEAASTERASVGTGGLEGNSGSGDPDITADGRFVVFDSSAGSIHPDDLDGAQDIYARDLANGTTEFISRASGATGVNGNGHSSWPSLSTDGRYVAFESSATNLHGDDLDAVTDIFVRDRALDSTTLASRANGVAGVKGNASSVQADMNGSNQTVVAFHSFATNLDPADVDGQEDVFVREVFNGVTEYISRATGATGVAGNGSSLDASINRDGVFVAFESTATNLHPDDTSSPQDIYLRDRVGDTTTLVSRATGSPGVKANAATVNPSISADGRYIAFQSNATNLHPDDTSSGTDIFVRDVWTETTILVSRATGAAGVKSNGVNVDPAISPDGRFVTFDSNANNLAADDTNNISDVYVRDLVAQYTVRVSLADDGSQVFAGDIGRPAIAADGRAVAFHSDASFVPEDGNFVHDVMVRAADDDGDLFLEPADNCASVSNASQADTDADGLGDACDDDDDGDGAADSSESCDLVPEDADGYLDSDGCPDPDNDADGICDSGQASVACTGSDSGQSCFDPAGTLSCVSHDCRSVAEDIDAFKDGDGCPEPDNDNDGFPDVTDDCPGTASRAGPDGMLGSPQDLNHNGVRDGAEATLTTDDVMPALVWEDSDGVLDTDGCHDSPGDDFDGDGLTDDSEVFTHLTNAGHPDSDADTVIDGTDNCKLWPNPSQGVGPDWGSTLGTGPDSDCDRFTNSRESYLGTDATRQCPANTGLNNEAVDSWPLDTNDNRIANTIDAGQFVFVLNKTTAQAGSTRLDFNQNGIINTVDVGRYVFALNESCSPSGP